MLRKIFRALFLPLRLLFFAPRWFWYKASQAIRRWRLPKQSWVEIDLHGTVVEYDTQKWYVAAARNLIGMRDPPTISLSALRRLTDRIASDPKIAGTLVRLGPLDCGWSAAISIRDSLAQVKDARKPVLVHCLMHQGNLETLITSAATRLVATPVATFAVTGAASRGLFLKDALERIGLRFFATAAGRYKSGPDTLTKNERSEADAEQTKEIIDAFDDALIEAVADGRNLSLEEATQAIDGAPYSAQAAVENGLWDDLVRDEEVLETAQDLAGLDKVPKTLKGVGRLREPPRLVRRKRVGIVEVRGIIVEAASVLGISNQGQALSGPIVNALREALEDDEIAAVILYVDSRGGSVVASDQIYSAVRRLGKDKPVVAYLADVAASGGYYVACGAQQIVASELTITGSIGVYRTLPIWRQAAERLAIHSDLLSNRAHAGIYSGWSTPSEEEQALSERDIQAMYDTFLEVVGEARHLSKEQIHTHAQGRVWTGRQAKAKGLVDILGGMPQAISTAKTASGARFYEAPALVQPDKPRRRPPPAPNAAQLLQLAESLNLHMQSPLVSELLTLVSAPSSVWAYHPLWVPGRS